MTIAKTHQRANEVIYVQHPNYTGTSNQTPSGAQDLEDSWSSGVADEQTPQQDRANNRANYNPVPAGLEKHAAWSDDEHDDSVPNQGDSLAISINGSSAASDSDDSSGGSAAMAAAHSMTQPVPRPTVQPATTIVNPPGNQAQPSRAKCYCYQVVGPTVAALSAAGLGWGISLILTGADVLPRGVEVDGTPIDSNRFYLLGGLVSAISSAFLIAVVCLYKQS